MTLRTTGDHLAARARRPSGLRLLGFSAVLVALILGAFAGSSGAGVASYTGTLYFSGPSSSVAGNYQLLTTNGPGFMTAPTVAAGAANSGGVPTGLYRYVFVSSSGGASTASYASTQVSVTNAPVTVSFPVGAPGTVDLYRSKNPSGTTTGTFILLASGISTATPYVDSSTATTGAGLPQADTRAANGVTGYAPFVAGTSLGSSIMNSTFAASVSIPGSCAGWIVDAAGGMSFAAGTWTFNAEVRADSNGNGAAALTVAMWKVDNSGATIAGGTVVPVTDSGAIALNGTNQTVTASFTTSSATTLDTNEHLCVQFWRHQSTAYSTGGATTHNIWLLGWSANSRISAHPAPNGFASAALASPADGSRTQTVPTLGATYTDAEGDSGTVTIRLCSDSGCGTVLQNSGALAAPTSGSTPTWSPTGPLADGTYWWQAQAKDNPGLATAWTASRSFVIDTVAPTTAITANPPALSNSASGSFSFVAGESVTGYQCHLDAAAYAGCSSPFAYSGLIDGSHTFYVKASADLAGNAGTQTSYAWTIDTAAPNTSITSSPASLSNSSSPSFTLSSTEPGSSFECKLDAGSFGACPNPQTYSGVADGPHTFQARAIDAAGNVDATPVSYAWTIDATAPDTTIGPTKPALLTTSTSATFDFSSTESGSSFECSRDGAAYVSCTSPKTYSGLADATHTFDVRATDLAGNTDPTPASYSWTVDTTPPDTTIGPTKPPANSTSTAATFDFAATETGSIQCHLDGAAYGPCTSPISYAGLGDGSHTFFAEATDAAGNTDPTPASYSWTIDTIAPSTPALTAPADGFLTNAPPQLRATFSDATPGDSGTVDFQVCSSAAPAGTACAPLVTSATSGSVANGGTATTTPGPLASGTYHWQARARDVAGNLSGWSTTRSFQIDSAAPAVPLLEAPDDGAWIRTVRLKGVFAKPSFAGTGTVEFRICSDGACLGIVSTGSSTAVANGETASWAPASSLRDGLYYWQARARDAAGNQSAWSATRTFNLDTTPPPVPLNFNGQVTDGRLTLRWDPPAEAVANFYVYVDGVSTASVDGTTHEYAVGPFDAGDSRTFAVVAVDRAGNQSQMSKTLAGVPNMVGLTLSQAEQAASARGFVVKRESSIQSASGAPGVVVAQDPVAPSMAPQGSAVTVVVSGGSPKPLTLTLTARPGRAVCRAGGLLRLRVQLSEAAVVRARLVRGKARALATSQLGRLPAGTSDVRVRLPRHLARGSYRLLLDATSGTRAAQATVRLSTGSRRVCGSK